MAKLIRRGQPLIYRLKQRAIFFVSWKGDLTTAERAGAAQFEQSWEKCDGLGLWLLHGALRMFVEFGS